MTEFSQRNSADTSIKGDLHFKELPVNMVENDGNLTGNWIGLLSGISGTPGRLTGKVEGNKMLTGITFIGSGTTTPQDSINFTLSESGLTFTGEYWTIGIKPPSLHFYWNGTKISDCACTESMLKNDKTYKIK